MSRLALVADLGGTNVRFALADADRTGLLRPESIRRFRVSDFPSLSMAALHYRAELEVWPRHALFAVAGRVEREQVAITNHPWHIEIEATRRHLELERLDVLNDFAVLGRALPLLDDDDLRAIGPALPDWTGEGDRCCAVLGPGTGLGVGALLRRRRALLALPSEGGHVGFAPTDALQIELLQRLRGRFGRVSTERLISGPGLANVHQALVEIAGMRATLLSPAAITAGARDDDALCRQSVAVCLDLLADFAGDLVLAFGAWDGAYLAGGLVRELWPWLSPERFRQRFEAKGRFTETMTRVPLAAIVHPEAGLFACAALALAAGE